MAAQPIKKFKANWTTSYLLADVTPTDDEYIVLEAGQAVVIVAQRKTFSLVECNSRNYLIDNDTLVVPFQ